ncbi:hypothetical protein [Pseudomonas aeruginosa]|jgi:hypothetical protein|uniref:hypothetical protein n=1 Tax=Pseudomonas aeruginosa TaxID=287 RepID=UPI001CBBB7D4|nr:hypothetical protein [Pseudomonas aeruginosa]EMA2592567.1 hypothetical protein [Pseudomonas aeruginosa]MBX6882430.1 hypothetical protein [Pseudomonas aeruginosa]MBX6932620.1 hypothetical protein [Pseudomonas aeruginosa]MBZ3677380.1 hypothetical protein [Pseudomonas aeruginosa]MBZ3688375.1 hypothetical protein [Pseudomonas aeruginosa]
MNNQASFRSLIEKTDITQAEAAKMIAEETKRPCSVRSVRAWLAEAELQSARPCPEWAVQALESRLRTLGKIE